MNLECKDKKVSRMYDHLLPLIDSYDLKNQIAISSFNHEYHDELLRRGLEHEYEFGFLYNAHGQEDPQYNWERKGTMNIYADLATEEKIKLAHSNGNSVMVWFWRQPEESEDFFLRIIQLGVDVICTNYPDVAIRARSRYAEEQKKKNDDAKNCGEVIVNNINI